MISINITEDVNSKSEMVDMLRRIAELIERGFTSGYYPTWELLGEGEDVEEY